MRHLTILALCVSLIAAAVHYNRKAWRHWIDADHDCQDTRTEVLIDQADGHVTLSHDGCKVVVGLWDDPYTGMKFTKPSDIQIDHIIPLEAAWQRGGWQWDAKKREEYANWMPGLIAVQGRANQSKGNRGPAEWLPPAMDKCEYVELWFDVAREWDLFVTTAEASMYADCVFIYRKHALKR